MGNVFDEPRNRSNEDLLNSVIGSVGRELGPVGVALMRSFGSLRGIDAASFEELVGVEGLGRKRVRRVRDVFLLARRWEAEKRPARPRFRDSASVFEFVHVALRDLDREVFEVLVLDARNALLVHERVSVGTLTGSLVHPREVFRPAIRAGGAAVVVLHNHPSGDATPSVEDLEITQRLVVAGEILGIRVLDHLIVGDGEYVSLADRGEISRDAPASRRTEHRHETLAEPAISEE